MAATENLICYALCYFWEVPHCMFMLYLCEAFGIITFYSHQEVVVSSVLKTRFKGEMNIYYLDCMHSRHS